MQAMEQEGSRLALSRTERRQRTRESVLEAAERSFRRHGFRETTMHLIAAEAGVSKATIYAYFGSKEGLLRELQERARGELLRQLGPAGEEEPLLQLERAFDCCCDLIRQRDSLGLAESGQGASASAFSEGSPENEALKRLTSILRSGVERGVFRPLHPELGAFLLFKSFEACVHYLQRPDCPLGLEQTEDGLFDFIRRGIMV